MNNITYFKIPAKGDFKSVAEFVWDKTGISIEWVYFKVIEPNLQTMNPKHTETFIYSNITNAWELLENQWSEFAYNEFFRKLTTYNPIELTKEEIFTELI